MKQATVLKYLQQFSNVIPAAVSCLDLEQKYLEINDAALKASGSTLKKEDFYGKSPRDFFKKEVADILIENHKKVTRSQVPFSVEESITDVRTGEAKYFNTLIAPLLGDENELIGTVCTSIDITAQKREMERLEKERIFVHLKEIASFIPANVYWLDSNNIILGVNSKTLAAIGLTSYSDIIGKTVYDLYPKSMADEIVEHHTEAMRTNQTLRHEEVIQDVKTGEIKYFATVKAPLYDNNGDTIGTIGISLDITSEKQSEKLALENASQKTQLQAHDAFSQVVNQVVHDIRSPLASLLMIVKACSQIPERERLALRGAATSIGAIANNLLAKYNAKDTTAVSVGSVEGDESEAVLVSVALLQLLTHKNFQYQSANVNFDHTFTSEGEFAFIQVNSSDFTRALSNLINNSVDALDSSSGKVILTLDADADCVKITLKDNGKGIPPDVLEKIRQKIEVTSGKEDGHGIGLGQVQEMLATSDGKMRIDSTEGEGTEITLSFPRVHTITWIADKLTFYRDNIVVVLDDDHSIHHAWDTRFESLALPLEVKHFHKASETVAYINNLTEERKRCVFLLSDFELLKQDLDGLDVIEKVDVSSSVLVTSYYSDREVRERAKRLNIKILPKQLTSDVPMFVCDRAVNPVSTTVDGQADGLEPVDIILVDDNESFANSLIWFVFANEKVAWFQDPEQLRKALSRYSRKVPIYLDNNFASASITGLDFAKELHQSGFEKLFLLTGENLSQRDVPTYVTLVGKHEIDKIKLPL
jgi:PAS domain S-box-containing protein